MKKELKPVYESVESIELKPGDVCCDGRSDFQEHHTVVSVGDHDGEFVSIDFGRGKTRQLDDACFYRKLPDRRHPEVLMRALEMACAVATNTALLDPNVKVLADGLIDRALEEIENKSVE